MDATEDPDVAVSSGPSAARSASTPIVIVLLVPAIVHVLWMTGSVLADGVVQFTRGDLAACC